MKLIMMPSHDKVKQNDVIMPEFR